MWVEVDTFVHGVRLSSVHYPGRRDLKFIVSINEFASVWCTEASSTLRIKVPYNAPKGDRGGTVVKLLRYKSDGRWFDSRWYH